ncbi:MAG: preprotein translocase subunit SecG [Clostridia bacterium]|nr:preprotein translocase subunit SecG [Clostridia bacterium]MBQ6938019.1 preprotein translocase subunit SecG [Clostridia bacterium]
MKLAFTIVYIVVALILTVVVLFQKGKDPREASSVMGTSGETFFSKNKANTREGLLEKLTTVFAIVFIILSVVLSLDLLK